MGGLYSLMQLLLIAGRVCCGASSVILIAVVLLTMHFAEGMSTTNECNGLLVVHTLGGQMSTAAQKVSSQQPISMCWVAAEYRCCVCDKQLAHLKNMSNVCE